MTEFLIETLIFLVFLLGCCVLLRLIDQTLKTIKRSFRRQKPWHGLGGDVPTVINELKIRKHWKDLPPALIEQFGFNATYVFDRPGEAADAIKQLVFLLESESFQGRLQQIGSAENWRSEVSVLSDHLHQLASAVLKSLYSSGGYNEREASFAYSILISSLVCERYALCSYALLADLVLAVPQDTVDAALWCDRYRRAESDVLSEDESNIGSYASAVRVLLNHEMGKQTVEEMRRALPKHLQDKHLPDFEPSALVSLRNVVDETENLILEETCHGHV